MSRRLTIVYVVGSRNCGSTLLEAILGSAPGARSLGEVGGFHRYRSAPACDCGEAPASCGPCQAVVSALAARRQLAALHRLGPLPLREHRAHWTLVPTRTRAEYARVADAVFSAVAAETGSAVLVDSSKNVGRAAALVHESRHDVHIIHLVRDGRGYVASRRRRAEADGRRHRPIADVAGWAAKNLLISTVLRRRTPPGRYLCIRYEDLVRDPATELARIGAFAGVDTAGLAAAATGEGVTRRHLFEPPRRVDYRLVRLDRDRLGSERLSAARNLGYWASGGAVSARWGYDRRQSHLDVDLGARAAPSERAIEQGES